MKLGLENFHFAGGFSVISKILLGGVFTLLLPQVLSAEQIRGQESIEFFDRAMRALFRNEGSFSSGGCAWVGSSLE